MANTPIVSAACAGPAALRRRLAMGETSASQMGQAPSASTDNSSVSPSKGFFFLSVQSRKNPEIDVFIVGEKGIIVKIDDIIE
jgi:hypothetical protein